MNEKRRKLTGAEVTQALESLPGWSISDGKLHREYQFSDFVEAWGFMARAALVVQAMEHHPEWFNVYHTVRIDLVTHDAGGITGMDTELAGRLESLAGVK